MRTHAATVTVAALLAACAAACSSPAAGPPCQDTSSDPYHCGACGHSCWGGACFEGACQPVTASAGGFTAVQGDLVASGGVYVTRLHSYRDVIGGPFTPFASGPIVATDTDDPAWFVALDNRAVYWSALAGVRSCALPGCPDGATQLVPGTGVSARPIAVTDGTLVVGPLITVTTEPQVLKRCAADGCPSLETFYTASGTLGELRADRGRVVFTEGDSLRLCELARCEATVQTLSTRVRTSSMNDAPPIVALADDTVAWLEFEQSAGAPERVLVKACPAASCTAPLTLLAEDLAADRIWFLTVAEGSLFMGRGLEQAGRIFRCALAGCDAPEQIELVRGPQPPDAHHVVGMIHVTPDFYVVGSHKVAR